MPSPYDPNRVLTLRVTPELRARLDAIAQARGTTRHALAVDALDAWAALVERRAGGGGTGGATPAPRCAGLESGGSPLSTLSPERAA